MAPRVVLERFADRFLEAYNNAYNLEAMLAIRADDCVNVILPESMETPPMNNQQYAAWIGPILGVLHDFRLQQLGVTIDTERNRIAMHLKSSATSDLGPYAGEYCVTVTTNEDGTRMTRFEEFVDGILAVRYIVPLRKLLKKREREAKV